MNLCCFEGKKEIDLWQTPTHITYMCLSINPSGKYDGGEEGVRRRYLIWVEAQANGAWKDPEDLAYMEECIREHTKKIRSLKKPRFFEE
jgi:hypothetical protein